MNTRKTVILLVIVSLLITCSGCSSGVTMPHSSDEYESGNWTVVELIAHFEELGFYDFDTSYVRETFDEDEVGIDRVAIEDPFADSWFTEYRDFDKGEQFSTSRKILISADTLIPTLTIDNCSDFAELVQKDIDSSEKDQLWALFMASHRGEYLEFNGEITSWYDALSWIGVSFTVSVEGSDNTALSWSSVSLDSDHTNGVISEGVQVHMIVKIKGSGDDASLEIVSMDVIK